MKTAAMAFTMTLATLATGTLLAQNAKPDPTAILSATREALGGEKKLTSVKTIVATGRTQQVRGNKAVAARLLGISRRAFYRQLERHGLHQRVPADSRAATSAHYDLEQV